VVGLILVVAVVASLLTSKPQRAPPAPEP
jgi:hypothetical protein